MWHTHMERPEQAHIYKSRKCAGGYQALNVPGEGATGFILG